MKEKQKLVPVTTDKHKQLVDRSKNTGITISYQVDQALENYFKNNGGNDEEK